MTPEEYTGVQNSLFSVWFPTCTLPWNEPTLKFIHQLWLEEVTSRNVRRREEQSWETALHASQPPLPNSDTRGAHA